jgi:metal-responsive CopG/Arc/MetJ family transcriptional regulator
MQTVQVVIDEELLHEADSAARQFKVNRSALVRNALRAYLRKWKLAEMERSDRKGYEREPDDPELDVWMQAAVWPQD